MEIKYRIASQADLEEVTHLVKHAIETMDKQNIPQWDEIYPNKEVLREDICKKQLYVGTVHKQIAVIYVLNKECDDAYKNGKWQFLEKPFMVIHRLCVNPVFQGKGIARATLVHIEQELKGHGIAAIRLDVFTKNPYALKLYDGLGYSKVGHADWRKGRFYLMEKYLYQHFSGLTAG